MPIDLANPASEGDEFSSRAGLQSNIFPIKDRVPRNLIQCDATLYRRTPFRRAYMLEEPMSIHFVGTDRQ